ELADVVREFRKAMGSVVSDFRDAFQKVADEAEYRFDKEFGKQMAKHPELYADLKKGYRQTRKFFDEVAADLGLK
ncbi:MAG: hypothetical protein ACPHK8_02795, partial [Thermoplasmatota archaeon]